MDRFLTLLVVTLTIFFSALPPFGGHAALSAPASKAKAAAGVTVRFTSFKAANEEALRLGATEAGKAYLKQTGPILIRLLIDARKDYTGPGRGSGPRFIEMDFAFVVAADGRIEQLLHEPEFDYVRYVAARLPALRLSPPPKPGWVVRAHFSLQR